VKPASPLFKLVGVAIVKDEASYIEEWLCYHLRLGFEHFVVFDNGSSDNTAEVLKPYINYGVVTYVHWPLFPGQMDAYGFALRAFGHLTEWMSFFDPDEFYVLKKHATLVELLAGVDADQLLVFWKMFGHSGHRARPPGLVVAEYAHCEDSLIGITKSIVRPSATEVAFVHNCLTTTGRTVNDRGQTLREDWRHEQPFRSEELVCINHYFTRSYEEYAAKIQRGQVDGRSEKKLEPFSTHDYAKRDTAAIAAAAPTAALMEFFHRLPVQPHRYGGLSRLGSVSNPRNFVMFSQQVAREAIAAIAPANGEMQHYWYGTLAYFSDVSVGDALAAWADAQIADWSAATKSTIASKPKGDAERRLLFHNGRAAEKAGSVEFVAENEDPQIVAPVATPEALGYYWVSAVIRVPQKTTLDAFAFGHNAHGTEMFEARMAHLEAGVYLALVMINSEPLKATSVRIDPGACPGTYQVWNMTAFHCP